MDRQELIDSIKSNNITLKRIFTKTPKEGKDGKMYILWAEGVNIEYSRITSTIKEISDQTYNISHNTIRDLTSDITTILDDTKSLLNNKPSFLTYPTTNVSSSNNIVGNMIIGESSILDIVDHVQSYNGQSTLSISNSDTLILNEINDIDDEYNISFEMRLNNFPTKIFKSKPNKYNSNPTTTRKYTSRRSDIISFNYDTENPNNKIEFGAMAPFGVKSNLLEDIRLYENNFDNFSIAACLTYNGDRKLSVYTDYKFKLGETYSIKLSVKQITDGYISNLRSLSKGDADTIIVDDEEMNISDLIEKVKKIDILKNDNVTQLKEKLSKIGDALSKIKLDTDNNIINGSRPESLIFRGKAYPYSKNSEKKEVLDTIKELEKEIQKIDTFSNPAIYDIKLSVNGILQNVAMYDGKVWGDAAKKQKKNGLVATQPGFKTVMSSYDAVYKDELNNKYYREDYFRIVIDELLINMLPAKNEKLSVYKEIDFSIYYNCVPVILQIRDYLYKLMDSSLIYNTIFNFTKSNYGSEVDIISKDLSITRSNEGGIYNPIVETKWNGSGPSYTTWNSEFIDTENYGWSDLTNLSSRKFGTFLDSLNGQIGDFIIGRELVMFDETTSRYWKVRFYDWTPGSAGGGFQYTRELIAQEKIIDYDELTSIQNYILNIDDIQIKNPIIDNIDNLIKYQKKLNKLGLITRIVSSEFKKTNPGLSKIVFGNVTRFSKKDLSTDDIIINSKDGLLITRDSKGDLISKWAGVIGQSSDISMSEIQNWDDAFRNNIFDIYYNPLYLLNQNNLDTLEFILRDDINKKHYKIKFTSWYGTNGFSGYFQEIKQKYHEITKDSTKFKNKFSPGVSYIPIYNSIYNSDSMYYLKYKDSQVRHIDKNKGDEYRKGDEIITNSSSAIKFFKKFDINKLRSVNTAPYKINTINQPFNNFSSNFLKKRTIPTEIVIDAIKRNKYKSNLSEDLKNTKMFDKLYSRYTYKLNSSIDFGSVNTYYTKLDNKLSLLNTEFTVYTNNKKSLKVLQIESNSSEIKGSILNPTVELSISPELPTGLILNNNGIIYGETTITTDGYYTITAVLYDNGYITNKKYNINLNTIDVRYYNISVMNEGLFRKEFKALIDYISSITTLDYNDIEKVLIDKKWLTIKTKVPSYELDIIVSNLQKFTEIGLSIEEVKESDAKEVIDKKK
jgi:hypothetical protein